MVRFCSPLRPSHHHVCVSSPFRAAPCRATPRYTALRRTRGRYRINVSLITYPAAATPPFSSTGISPPSNRLRQPPLRPLPPPPPPSPFCSIDPSPLPTCLPSVPRYPPLPPKAPRACLFLFSHLRFAPLTFSLCSLLPLPSLPPPPSPSLLSLSPTSSLFLHRFDRSYLLSAIGLFLYSLRRASSSPSFSFSFSFSSSSLPSSSATLWHRVLRKLMFI